MPHTVEEAYEVADAALERRRCEAARRARRPALPELLPRTACCPNAERATSSGVARGITRSSLRVIRTCSATSRPRAQAGCARTGSGSSASRKGARASSTTSPRRCRRCCWRARCSGVPPRRVRLSGRRRRARRSRRGARRASGRATRRSVARASSPIRAGGGARRRALCLRERRPAAERRPRARAARGGRALPRARRSRPSGWRAPRARIGRNFRSPSRTSTSTAAKECGMSAIAAVHGRQVVDSRGNPTVEVEVTLDSGAVGPRRGSLGRVDRRPRGGRAARRGRGLGRQGRARGPSPTSTASWPRLCGASTRTTRRPSTAC